MVQKRKKPAPPRPTETVSTPATPPSSGVLGDGTGVYPQDIPLYTVRQLAQHLQVNRQTIRRMVQLGQIPYVRVGRQIRFDILAVRGRLAKAT